MYQARHSSLFTELACRLGSTRQGAPNTVHVHGQVVPATMYKGAGNLDPRQRTDQRSGVKGEMQNETRHALSDK